MARILAVDCERSTIFITQLKRRIVNAAVGSAVIYIELKYLTENKIVCDKVVEHHMKECLLSRREGSIKVEKVISILTPNV